MVLFGALTGWMAYSAYGQFTYVADDDLARTVADRPGGNFTLQVGQATAQEPAHVRTSDFNGTELSNFTVTSGEPQRVKAERLALRIEVTWQNGTWTRNMLVPNGFQNELRLNGSSAAHDPTWLQPDSSGALPWLRGIMGIGALLVVTGVFAFRLRAPVVALVGAYAFLAGGLALVALALMSGLGVMALLQPVLLAAMGGFCVWAFRKGKDRFQPLQIGPMRL